MQYVLTIIAITWFFIGISTSSTTLKINKDTPNNHVMVVTFNLIAGVIEMSASVICLCIIWTS